MIYLILAVLTSTSILIIFKVFPKLKIDAVQAITVNYIVAVIFGYTQCKGGFTFANITGKSWFPFAILIGLTFISVFNVFAISTRKVGVAHTSVASKMSVVFPVLLGFIILGEPINALKIIGIALAFLAFYLTFKTRGSTRIYLPYIFFPLVLFIGNGFNDSMLKIIQVYHIRDDFQEFLTMVFLTALFAGITIAFVIRSQTRKPFHWNSIPSGILLGILNWYSTYFFMVGMKYFDISVYIPVFNVALVALSSITGYLIFKERLSLINWSGIILAMLSIIMIAAA
jgi:drug/metabolite transporter (DMT)-like permease